MANTIDRIKVAEEERLISPHASNVPVQDVGTWKPKNTQAAIEQLHTELGNKQSTLVNGETIKSINGNSLLGEGNIEIKEEHLIEKTYAPAEFSGLGRKYLQKNIVSDKNVLTQAMMQDANTIYVIQYDYDLNGLSITVPSGCVLQFNGGSLRNGTINGNGTTIDAGNTKIFDSVTFSGSFSGALNALWIGAKANDSTFDNSPILQAWFTSYSDYFRVIEFPLDNYYFLTPCVKSDVKRFREIRGNNSNFYVHIPDSNGTGQYFLTINGESFKLKDVTIRNTRTTSDYNLSKTRCVYLNQAQLFSFVGVNIFYFDVAVQVDDVWYGGFSGVNSLFQNRVGILALCSTSSEINTIDFRNLRMRGVSVATAQAVWSQDDGESDADYAMRTASVALDFHCISNNCKFDSVTMEGFDYGIRFNYQEHSSRASMTGMASISKCYFEANRVYDIYVGKGWIIKDSGYTSFLVTSMVLTIESCLFHTLKKSYFKDSVVTMIGCHESCEVEIHQEYGTMRFSHDSSAYCNSYYAIKLSPKNTYWNNSGQQVGAQTNLRAKLESQQDENLIILPYRNAQKLNTTYNNNISGYNAGSVVRRTFEMYPSVSLQDIIQPLRCNYNIMTNRMNVEVSSGGTKRMANAYYNYAIQIITSKPNNSIPLFEFLRRWDAGIAYTGEVNHLFPYTIVATPDTGEIKNESGTLVGFGKKALIDGTFNPSSVGFWIDVDSMCAARWSYSYLKFSSDLIQCARTYNEVLPNEDASGQVRQYKCSTSVRDSKVAKRINAIIFNTTAQKYEIYNGFEWVELTNRYQRYEYVEQGKSIAERATLADFPGQTYFNEATGITYTFWVNTAHTAWGWRSAIGNVDSLTNPNGYDATNNPVNYATELAAGECVNYQGNIYKWDGSGFVKVGGDIQIVHTTQTDYDALLTKDSNTLYAIDE